MNTSGSEASVFLHSDYGLDCIEYLSLKNMYRQRGALKARSPRRLLFRLALGPALHIPSWDVRGLNQKQQQNLPC